MIAPLAPSSPSDQVSESGPATTDLHARVLRATRLLIARAGLEVSMDQIADAAGVGRRTLFRHFESRDALVGQALESAFQWYETRLGETLQVEGPPQEWLATVLRRTHQTHLEAGRGLWQLASAFDDDLPAEYSAANRRRRTMRGRITRQLAERAWLGAGGQGEAPDTLVDAIATVVSSFATHSMITDRKRGVDAFVRSGVAILMAVLQAELTAAQSTTRRA